MVPKGDELIIRANPDTAYHGIVTASRMDVDENWAGSCFLLRRLSVTIELGSSPKEGPLAYLDHIAQPCRVGTTSGNDFPFTFSPSHQNDMYFAGRKRPLIINLDWLKHWIRLCYEEHEETCKLAEEQSQSFL